MEKQAWVNYGDVNPLVHGGIFVLAESETTFRIIKVDPPGTRDYYNTKYVIQDLYVDTTDEWHLKDKADVEAYADCAGAAESDPVRYALALIEYYSPGNFGCHVDVIVEPEEIEAALASCGIVVE